MIDLEIVNEMIVVVVLQVMLVIILEKNFELIVIVVVVELIFVVKYVAVIYLVFVNEMIVDFDCRSSRNSEDCLCVCSCPSYVSYISRK